MTRRAFDRFMVMVELAGNPKVARLNDAEFRCLVSGVWPLAAKAKPRGALRVADMPAEAGDVAHQSRQTVTVARRTLEKLRQLGMVEHNADLGCEVVHDWDEVNPTPKPSDTPEARRARKQAQREREKGVTPGDSHSDVTRDPSGEVEVEGEVSADADTSADPPRLDVESLCDLLADLIETNGSKRPTVTRAWRDAARLLLDRDGRDTAEAGRLIRWSQGHHFWRSNVLSMPKFREKYDQLRLQADAGNVTPLNRSGARQPESYERTDLSAYDAGPGAA